MATDEDEGNPHMRIEYESEFIFASSFQIKAVTSEAPDLQAAIADCTEPQVRTTGWPTTRDGNAAY